MLVTPEILLRAYAAGLFPMAESADDPDLFWVEPEFRGIIPLHQFHVPRRLKRTLRNNPFEIRFNTGFWRRDAGLCRSNSHQTEHLD